MWRSISGAAVILAAWFGLAAADEGVASSRPSGVGAERILERVQQVDGQVQRLVCLAARGSLPGDADLRGLRATIEELRRDPEVTAKAEALRLLVAELERATRDGVAPAVPAGTCGPARGVRVGAGRGEDAPPNDECAQATVIGEGTFSGTTAEATNDGQASCGASMFAPDVWFRYVASSSGMVAADTYGSAFDTVLSVHTGCPGTVSNQVACNDDAWGLDSAVAFSVSAGQELLIRVSGYGGATGDYLLHVGPTAAVSGYVFHSGAPLQSVPVRLFDLNGGFVGSAVSDATGAYTVGGLVGGTVFVGTGLGSLEFVDELYDDILCPGGAPSGCDPTTGTPVTVTPGSVTCCFDFELARGGILQGWVSSAITGSRIAGATVTVYDQTGSLVGTDISSTTEQWTVGGLLPGDHFVVASHPLWADKLYLGHPCEGGCNPLDGDPVHISLNVTTHINMFLDPLGSLSGRLTEAGTGIPLVGDWVEVYDGAGDWVDGTSAGVNGYYTVGGLDTGSYFVRTSTWHHADELYDDLPCEPECSVTSGTPVGVAVGVGTGGIDFELVLLGRLAGRITEEVTGNPIPDAWVAAYDALGLFSGGAPAGSDGSYLVPDLAGGTYFVRTDASWLGFADELYDDLPCYSGCQVMTGTPVSVSNGSVTGAVDFALSELGAISGTVTDAATGVPVEGIQVEAWTSQGRQESAVTDASGAYTVDRLGPGTYFVVTNSGGPFLDELFQEIPCPGGPGPGCNPTSGTPVTVTLASTSPDVDLTLDRGGVISGVITTAADGAPVAGVSVSAIDWTGVERGLGYSQGDGSYQVVGLPAGDYYAMASQYGYGTTVFDGVVCPDWPGPPCDYQNNGTIITVTPGTTIPVIDFALGRLGAISGAVVNSVTGNPIPGVSVAVYAGDGSQGPSVSTDDAGLYTVGGLYPSAYFAAARGAGLAPEVYDNLPCPFGVCVPTAGTPISVTLDHVAFHVDFALDPDGAISGAVTDELTGLPIAQGRVDVWGSSGLRLASQDLGSAGEYRVENLAPGPCFVTTAVALGYLDELYDDLPCLWGPPVGCDPTKGTPVIVPSGGVATGVDFALRFRESGVSGLVVSSETGEPVAGVRVDVWRGSDHGLVRSTATSATGGYLVSLSPSEYVISTDNGLGLIDEVYDDHECLLGSALTGSCDLGQGDPVTVTSGELTTGVDFALRRATLFSDGFESGTIAAWSSVVP